MSFLGRFNRCQVKLGSTVSASFLLPDGILDRFDLVRVDEEPIVPPKR